MSAVFATVRTVFDRALTGFVIFLLASLAVMILVGVACRKLEIPLV